MEVDDFLSSLPEEAALMVLSLLSFRDRAHVACSCAAWRALARRPVLWEQLSLSAADVRPQLPRSCSPAAEGLPFFTQLLASSGGAMRTLELDGIPIAEHPSALMGLLLGCRGLRELRLFGCGLRVAEASFILRHCLRLSRLVVDLTILGDELLNSGCAPWHAGADPRLRRAIGPSPPPAGATAA